MLEDSVNNLSASDSDSPIPTCMPFSWFGDSHKEHSSSSTLSFSQGGHDVALEQSQEKNRNKVNGVYCIYFVHLDLINVAQELNAVTSIVKTKHVQVVHLRK